MMASQLVTNSLHLCLFLIIAQTICKSLYRSWLLRNVPGPWYTLISDWSLLWHEYKYDRTRWIHELHARYGPIVRLSNSEVHYNSVEAVKKIYGVRSSVVKEPYYAEFAKDGHENMFSTIDDANHAEKKRGIANHYARSSVLAGPTLSMLQERVSQFCALLDDSQSVELYTTLSYFTLDVISSVVYGRRYCAGPLVNNEVNRSRIASSSSTSRNWRRYFRKAGHHVIAALTSATFSVAHKFRSATSYAAKDTDDIDGFIIETCERLLAKLTRSSINDPPSLAEKLLDRGCTEAHMLSETRDNVIAGSDTTTTVLTYLFYTLASRPDIYLRLNTELSRLGRDDKEHFAIQELEACTYLDGVITEALRLFAAIPMTLPRVLTVSLEIHGRHIPRGTRVGVQCYSMHRNPDIFPDPETYEPERWLDASRNMHDHMWAFSSGSRACIGKALALLEMKLIVAEVVSRFSISLTGQPNRDAMDMSEDTTGFSMAPTDKKLRLLFKATAM